MDELAGTVAVPRLKGAADAARAVFSAALDLALPRLCAAYGEPVEGHAFLYHTAFLRTPRHPSTIRRLSMEAIPTRPPITVLAPRFVSTTFPARWCMD
jgi:hypothetical protein